MAVPTRKRTADMSDVHNGRDEAFDSLPCWQRSQNNEERAVADAIFEILGLPASSDTNVTDGIVEHEPLGGQFHIPVLTAFDSLLQTARLLAKVAALMRNALDSAYNDGTIAATLQPLVASLDAFWFAALPKNRNHSKSVVAEVPLTLSLISIPFAIRNCQPFTAIAALPKPRKDSNVSNQACFEEGGRGATILLNTLYKAAIGRQFFPSLAETAIFALLTGSRPALVEIEAALDTGQWPKDATYGGSSFFATTEGGATTSSLLLVSGKWGDIGELVATRCELGRLAPLSVLPRRVFVSRFIEVVEAFVRKICNQNSSSGSGSVAVAVAVPPLEIVLTDAVEAGLAPYRAAHNVALLESDEGATGLRAIYEQMFLWYTLRDGWALNSTRSTLLLRDRDRYDVPAWAAKYVGSEDKKIFHQIRRCLKKLNLAMRGVNKLSYNRFIGIKIGLNDIKIRRMSCLQFKMLRFLRTMESFWQLSVIDFERKNYEAEVAHASTMASLQISHSKFLNDVTKLGIFTKRSPISPYILTTIDVCVKFALYRDKIFTGKNSSSMLEGFVAEFEESIIFLKRSFETLSLLSGGGAPQLTLLYDSI